MTTSFGNVQKTGLKSWKLTVSGGFDGGGKRIRHTKTVKVLSDDLEKQEKEARQQLALFISDIEKGQNANSGKMTLIEYFDYWLANYAIGRHAAGTIFYNQQLFKRIKVALGHKRLDQIQPKHLLTFYKNLSEPGVRSDKSKKDTLSSGTVRKYHVLLHSLLSKATQWQFIGYNPADKVEPPKPDRRERTVYDELTTGNFLILLEEEPLRYKTMVLLALSTGFRRGELFGLQWQHINFETATIKIEQASQYLPGKGIFQKDPKNSSSKRSVTITTSIIALLKQCKAEQSAKRLKLGGTIEMGGKWAGAKEPEADFLFTTWDGKAAQPDSINTWLGKFITRTGLPHLTPHDFRHMAATYLITSGVDLRTIAGKLGHTSSTTTQEVYSHLLKSAEQETTNKLETFLEKATETAKNAQKKQTK